jgi:hypothetical protein
MRNANILSSALGLLAVGLISLQGCDGAITVDVACDSLAASLCGRIDSCAPFIFENGYGDAATCEERVKARCVVTPELSGVTFSPDAIKECGDAYDDLSCEEVITNQSPDACRPEGEKPDGSNCAAGPECDGGYCLTNGEGQCGTCATPLPEGATCDVMTQVCVAGTYCSAASKCEKPGAKGDACSATQPCGGLSCNNGTCGDFLPVGADCSGGATCDFTEGLYCNAISSTCAQLGVAKLGEKCGVDLTTDALTVCEADVECDFMAEQCVARLKDGDSCTIDTQSGTSHCAVGLQCVEGKCGAGYPSCQ